MRGAPFDRGAYDAGVCAVQDELTPILHGVGLGVQRDPRLLRMKGSEAAARACDIARGMIAEAVNYIVILEDEQEAIAFLLRAARVAASPEPPQPQAAKDPRP